MIINGKIIGQSEQIILIHIPGDIDGNEVANNIDLVLLFQYLSGWNVIIN